MKSHSGDGDGAARISQWFDEWLTAGLLPVPRYRQSSATQFIKAASRIGCNIHCMTSRFALELVLRWPRQDGLTRQNREAASLVCAFS